MTLNARNILSVKRKRRPLVRTAHKQLLCPGANVCVGVEIVCRNLCGSIFLTNVVTI